MSKFRIIVVTLDYIDKTPWQRISCRLKFDPVRVLHLPFGQRSGEYHYFTKTFREMGHVVYDVPYTHWERRIHPYTFMPRIKRALEKFRPDFIFYNPQGEEFDGLYEIAKQYCPLITWGSDDDWRWDSYTSNIARKADLHVTTYKAIYEKAIKSDYSNVIRSQWGCVPSLHKPIQNKDLDVCFVGSMYGERKVLIDSLRKIIEKNRGSYFFGSGLSWKRSTNVLGRALIQITPSAASASKTKQIKARHFEVPSYGSLQITDADSTQIGEYFNINNEIVCVDNQEEIINKVEYYLTHLKELNKIAQNGYKRCLSEHTYTHRLKNIINEMITRNILRSK